MGSSYQTVLVAASIDHARSALEVDGVEALLVPAGPGRTAVLPREGRYNVADSNGVAAALSSALKVDALSQQVVDSDMVVLDLYRHGQQIYRYVSDPDVYAEYTDQPVPPSSADPAAEAADAAAALAPIGTGYVDLVTLAATLRTDRTGRVFAEAVHEQILTALNLDPTAATLAFRWAVSKDLPGAVRASAPPSPDAIAQTQWWPLPVIIHTALPPDVDPGDAAQVLADAVTGQPVPMRAHVGYAPVIPGAALDPNRPVHEVPVRDGQQSATYFAQLQIHSPGHPPNIGQVTAVIDTAWTTAWSDRYNITTDQQPTFAPTTYDRFRIGYDHTHQRRTTREHPTH